VHERALLSPADALTEYGEDLLETKQRGLHVVIQPEPGISERSADLGARLEAMQQRLAPTARDERQLWLGVTLGAPDPSSLVTAVNAILATNIGRIGTHVLLMNRPPIP
jgi:hypothetical protein